MRQLNQLKYSMDFIIKSSIILFSLSTLCYWLPSKRGNKKAAFYGSILPLLIILLSLMDEFIFLRLFIWFIIVVFQIIFIIYWIIKIYN